MLNLDERRIAGLYIAIIIFAGIIFFKLYTISISDYGKVLPSLNSQYTRKINIAERRGFIFDRNGLIISGYESLYNCLIDPSKIDIEIVEDENGNKIIESYAKITETLTQIGDYESDYILKKLGEGKPFIIRTREELNTNYAKSYKTYSREKLNKDNNIVGLDAIVQPQSDEPDELNDNIKPQNKTAVHILGWLNSEGMGASGIELAYNDFLNKTGAKILGVYDSDAHNKSFKGSPIRTIDYGYNQQTGLMLTLDWDFQEKIEEIADNYLTKGAIVVTDVKSGEILASTSRPSYSPEHLVDYIESTNGEFVNRAFSAFTPGSVFKTVVAAAALEFNPELINYEHECIGYEDVYGQIFKCWKSSSHGVLAMEEAYAQSCNAYFISLALEIGYERIYDMAKNLGVGEFDFIDGLNAIAGNVPENNSPVPAFIANSAIGQGELLITPLEAARIFCAIANGGIMPELSLVKGYVFEDKTSDLSNTASRKVLKDKTVELLRSMTRACVERGTGMAAAPEFGEAGGKTSSAESGQFMEIVNEDGETIKEQIVHSWFAGYYPAEETRKPVYAISVIAEGGVNENVKSAAVFKEICDFLGAIMY